MPSSDFPPSMPDHIGPYRIIRLLGQGGMGVVYEAEQREPFRRMVALKVIRHGMDSRDVLRRFESERQALAVMDHPNIAKALDAGSTPDGRPYFVMELVEGVPINEYCDAARLDTRQRLELFVAVCAGVQHAHQKGVIHRDLKPSNILVREQDGKPVPTIIDFGIAKAVEGNAADAGFTTELGVAVGTPVYMSPEQAAASGLDIDTRADIYSLGMVLYELVTGVLPFDVRDVLPSQFIARHVLGDSLVPTPSRRLASLSGAEATPAASQRGTTPVGLRRQLRGDLDWIVLKAIDRDRARRYETANALAQDIQRYRDRKPVVARPPTTLYMLRKFVQRHRAGVVAGAVAVASLIGVTITTAMLARRAARERAGAEAISTFLIDMLKSADPWQGGARQTTVLEALKSGTAKLDGGPIRDPLIRASIRRTIGTVYLGLGHTAEADTLLRSALAERTARLGREDDQTAQSLSDLGALYIAQAKFDSARVVMTRALEIRRKLHGDADTTVSSSLLDLGDLAHEEGQYRREDSLARDAIVILRRVHGARSVAVADAMRRIASAQHALGNYKESESTARESVAMLRELGQARSPSMALVLNDLGLSRADQGDYAEGEALLKEVLAIDSANFGPMHPDLASDIENLGYIYFGAKRYDDDIAMLHQTLAIRRAMLGDDNPAIGRTIFNIAATFGEKRDYAAAEPLFEEALARLTRAHGPNHPNVTLATWVLGRNQYRLRRFAEAETNLRAALNVTDADARLDPTDYSRVAAILADVYIDQRRYAVAEPLALRALALRDSLTDTTNAGYSRRQLVRLYQGWGKPDRADRYRGPPAGSE